MGKARCERGGCDKDAKRRGLCDTHYERERSRHRHREDRVLPTRARNRATSRLIQAHKEEFDRLYQAALAEVTTEYEELKKTCEARNAEPTSDKQIYRFKRGPKPDDEELEDRIVPAAPICNQCEAYHASGHACLHCGALPSRAIFDEAALRKHNPASPILVPADMTDERINAAIARARSTESMDDKLDELREQLEFHPGLDVRIACQRAGLRMAYEAGDQQVMKVLEAAGRQVRRNRRDEDEIA